MAATSQTDRRIGPIVAALAITDVAFAFQQTAVIPAIPSIQRDFGSNEAWGAWLLTGYLIVASVATPLLGKLADRHGKRRMLLIALALFLLGSIGAALAPSMAVVIGFRALQGAGGAVFPLSISMLRDQAPSGRVAAAVGALTGAFGLGTAIGFGLSGFIVEWLGWRWIFVCGALLTAAALALTPMAVRRSPIRTPGGLDLPGAALLTGGLAALLVGLTEAAATGWGAPLTLGCFGAFVLLTAGWLRRDLTIAEPLVDLRVLGQRTVLFVNAATTLLGYVLFGVFFLIPYLARDTFGAGPIGMALLLLPAAAGQLIGGPASGWLAPRLEPRWILGGGMALTAVSSAALAASHTETGAVAALVFVLGLGAGLSIGVASAIVAQAVDEGETGIATALNSVLRRVGGGVGGQIAAALLATGAVASGDSSGSGFALAFAISAAVAAVGTGCALAVERVRAEPP